jgi:hypothetical protein
MASGRNSEPHVVAGDQQVTVPRKNQGGDAAVVRVSDIGSGGNLIPTKRRPVLIVDDRYGRAIAGRRQQQRCQDRCTLGINGVIDHLRQVHAVFDGQLGEPGVSQSSPHLAERNTV